jgi:hypothetical protein
MRDLQTSFDQLVPRAADKAELFLRVVLDRASYEDIGLKFVAKEAKRTKQVVLEAPIQLGGRFLKAEAMRLTVHADRVGSSLQVGWQLTEDSVHTNLMVFDSVASAQASRSLRNCTPEAQRQLNGLLNAFHEVIFLPVLGLLVDALEGPSRSGSGFLGA